MELLEQMVKQQLLPFIQYSFDLGYKVALQRNKWFFINDERVEEYSLTTPVQLGNFAHIQKWKMVVNFCNGSKFSCNRAKRIEGLEFALKFIQILQETI